MSRKPYVPKYIRGLPFIDVQSAADWIASGNPVYWNHKFTHSGWASGWQLRMIAGAVRARILFRAYRNPEHPETKKLADDCPF